MSELVVTSKTLNRSLSAADAREILRIEGLERIATRTDIKERDKALSASDYLARIESALSRDGSVQEQDKLSKLKATLHSPAFLEGLRKLRKVRSVNDASTPGAEAFHILDNLEGANRALVLSVLPTKPFRKFQSQLKKAHHLNPENGVVGVVNVYASPDDRQKILSIDAREFGKAFRREFPDIKLNSLAEFDALYSAATERPDAGVATGSLSKENTQFEILRVAGETRRLLEAHYGRAFRTAEELLPLFSLEPRTLELLQLDSSREVYELLAAKKSPFAGEKLLSQARGGFLDLAGQYRDAATSGGMAPKEAALLASKLGIDLQTLDVDDISKAIPNYPEKKEALFGEAFEQFVAGNPGLVESAFFARRLNGYGIGSLLQAFENRSAFEKRQKALRPFQDTESPIVDSSPNHAKEKLELLDAISQKGFTQLRLTSREIDRNPNWGAQSKVEFENAIAKVNSPRSEAIYRALIEYWGNRTPPLSVFVQALRNDSFGEFLLNRENARKFSTVLERYNFRRERFFSADLESHVQRKLEEVIDNAEILDRPATQRFILAALADLNGTISENDENYTQLLMLSPISRVFQIGKWLKSAPRSLSDKLDVLVDHYKFTPNDLRRSVTLSEDDVSRLGSESAIQEYLTLNRYEKAIPRDNFTRLIIATELSKNSEYKKAFHKLLSNGVRLDSPEKFDFVLANVLSDDEMRRAVEKEGFHEFWSAISNRLYAGVKPVEHIPDLVEVYRSVESNPELRSRLKSIGFDQISRFVRDDLKDPSFSPSAIIPLLSLAKDFSRERYKSVIAEIEPRHAVSGNLALLNEIAKNSELRQQLRDRNALLSEVKEMARKYPALERKVFDGVSDDYGLLSRVRSELSNVGQLEKVDTLTKAAISAGTEEARNLVFQEFKKLGELNSSAQSYFMITERIANFTKGYTERPDPEKLSNFELLQIVLVSRSLELPHNSAELGRLIWQSRHDSQSESGIEFVYRDRRINLVELRAARSMEGDGMSFEPLRSGLLGEGFLSGHLHAPSDEVFKRIQDELQYPISFSDFAGPSGYFPPGTEELGGDFVASKAEQLANIVASFVRHPKGKDGKEDIARAIVDVDITFPTGMCFDLGLREIPYSEKVTLPSGPQLIRR